MVRVSATYTEKRQARNDSHGTHTAKHIHEITAARTRMTMKQQPRNDNRKDTDWLETTA
ncbi:hypothetical protein [Parabacteroides goldsteinii]|uniref:hypothetical protein n=1 Tax=Parabacteroides goldsteinii TaxID=328812 RepID=UPI003EB79427